MSRPTHTNTLPPSKPHLGTGGSCTLVGAGPGDPELLTIKALKAIQAATVLLVDDLVSDAIVAHASPTPSPSVSSWFGFGVLGQLSV